MQRNKYIWFFILAIVSLTVWLAFVPHVKEPTYQGRSANDWLDDLANSRKTDYREAIHAMGTNILPYAIQHIQGVDDPLVEWYCRILQKLPNRVSRLMPKTRSNFDIIDGSDAFTLLGPDAIPQLIALLKHRSRSVRCCAAQALGTLGKGTTANQQIVSALTNTLDDVIVRVYSIMSLGNFGADASNAVPKLAECLAAPLIGKYGEWNFTIRREAAGALGRIGPGARAALPALKLNLHDPKSHRDTEPAPANWLAGSCALAIWRIDTDAETAMPALVQEFPGNEEYSKHQWLVALGEMGPRAKAAVPQLIQILQTVRILNSRHQEWMLNDLTNTLKAIDPEAAASAGCK